MQIILLVSLAKNKKNSPIMGLLMHRMVNAKSIVESQRVMNEISDDATRYNEQRIANSVISDQNLSLPGRNMDRK